MGDPLTRCCFSPSPLGAATPQALGAGQDPVGGYTSKAPVWDR